MIYELKDLTQFLSQINTKDIIKSKDKIFYNLAMSFDIETSSFYEDKNGVIYTNDNVHLAICYRRKCDYR